MTTERIDGDCLDVLPTLAPHAYDLLLTDPPYAMPAKYYESRAAHDRRWSDTSIMSGWWRQIMRLTMPLMRPDCALAVFSGSSAIPVFWPILFEVTKGIQLGVWDKGRIGMGSPLRMQTEFVIVGVPGRAYLGDKGVSNIFRFPPVAPNIREHPAQKPHDLLRKLIDTLCPPGGRVLDPFAGSYAVESACSASGRICTSIELGHVI